ncbi:precorrin-3B C(17)-methyltransferase [Actinospica robiniae]|uniref:precorrin-3B C(17)-methyltransferase n=1 Tax=Actinospica robiniae TaxID=304901 RepID=UPI00040FC70C|nr:precorrin-3B C(17)-methyltransferase [Actinospica robiniae]
MSRIGCVAATDSGREAAAYLAALWPDEVEFVDEGTVAASLRTVFGSCDAVIAFLATGATVRILAPSLRHKTTDAPVVCVDEGRRFAIALLGGHYGANDLARRVAGALGAEPVISNARDAAGIRPLPPLPRPRLVVGVGASRGVSADEVLETVDAALGRGGLDPRDVRALATVDLKADETGILAAARLRAWPLLVHPAAELADVEVPNPSAVVRAAAGTPSVAEAAARYAGPGRALGRMLVEKTKSPRENPMATAAVAAHDPTGRGRLAVIGLGPGARDLTAPRALDELRGAEVVVGLDQYVDQIRDLLPDGVRIEASGLGAEERRARSAVELANAGHRVALIGSGDAGVYAMASPALDDPETEGLDVVCVPGITAATAASNVLGAPLGHDHCAISLSDLHTPWPVIERRVRAAAEGDFVVSFYNPRSAKRDWQLPKALAVLAEHRPAETPIGWVRAAGRPDQSQGLTTLAGFDPAVVDMYTTVIVGCSQSRIVAGRFVTPRGYRWKE